MTSWQFYLRPTTGFAADYLPAIKDELENAQIVQHELVK